MDIQFRAYMNATLDDSIRHLSAADSPLELLPKEQYGTFLRDKQGILDTPPMVLDAPDPELLAGRVHRQMISAVGFTPQSQISYSIQDLEAEVAVLRSVSDYLTDKGIDHYLVIEAEEYDIVVAFHKGTETEIRSGDSDQRIEPTDRLVIERLLMR